MSDTNRTRIAYGGAEGSYAQPDAGVCTILRVTGDTLKQDTNVVASAEIRQDRQIADITRASARASGDINFELSYGAQDDFWRRALMSAGWSSAVTVSKTVINFHDAGYLLDASNGLGSFVVGQWVRITADQGDAIFNDAEATHVYAKITAKAAGRLDFEWDTDNPLWVTADSTSTVTIVMGAQGVNGQTLETFAVERKYNDITKFASYRGCAINTAALSINAEGILTGSFGIMAEKEFSSTTSEICNGTYTAAPANPVMNATDGVVQVCIGGVFYDVTSMSFNLNNNLRNRMVCGKLGPKSMGSGACVTQGTAQVYFESSVLLDAYLDFVERSIAVVVEDELGNAYIFDFPAMKFTSGQRVAGGQNQDVIADMAWSGKRDSTEDVTVRITRFAHA